MMNVDLFEFLTNLSAAFLQEEVADAVIQVAEDLKNLPTSVEIRTDPSKSRSHAV
jgi:hypothetical protein